MNILTVIIRRLARLILTVLVISITVFLLVRVIPGDPALNVAGINATQADIDAIRTRMGTDKPLPEQFAVWMKAVLRMDFGTSLTTGQPVLHMIGERFPLTLQLSVLSMTLALLIGIPLGILSAVKKDSLWDNLGTLLSLLGLSIPGFWLGMLFLLAFAVAIPIFPLFGSGTLKHLILPSITLSMALLAVLVRHTRNSLIAELEKEYVIAARAKGLSRNAVVFRHALKNALLPVITITGIQFGSVLGGAVIIEQVFSLPGLGRLVLTAVNQRDFPLVQGSILFIAFLYSIVNFAVDLLYTLVNPRVGEI